MPETVRQSRIKKFIQKKVEFMEHQQRIIDEAKLKGDDVAVLEYNQNAFYNYTYDLCKEFGVEMPHVLGVTPHK